MQRRFTIAAVIALSALASACAEDARRESADQPAHKAANPAAGKKPGSESGDHHRAADGPKQGDRESRDASGKTSGDRHEQEARHVRPTPASKPTAAEIQAARDNQGERQVDDLPPRLKRLRAIGAAKQGTPQEPRRLSPAEQRAFEIGTSAEYQNRHWARP